MTHLPKGIAVHAQSNVAERIHRNLAEMDRTILLQAGLPKFWWIDADNYSKMLKNLCETTTFGNTATPYHRFFQKEADITCSNVSTALE